MATQKAYFRLWFALWLLVMPAGLLSLPVAAPAQTASDYQAELSPSAMRLLIELQELSRSGEYEKGLQKLKAFTSGQNPPQNLPVLLGFTAANLNFQLKNYRESVTLYHQVVSQAPEFYRAYENYGMALLLAEDYHEAIRIFLQAAVKIPEKSAQLRYKAAIAALYGGDLKQARSILVELTAVTPSVNTPPPATWFKALIQVYWQLSETKSALVSAGRLVDLYPDEIANWRLYGQVAVAAGAYRKALSAYKVLQTNGQITLKERKLVASLYQQLGMLEKSAEILAGVYDESEPGEIDLKRLIALYRQSGQTEKALQTLKRLQKLYPDTMNLFIRAEILYAAGRYHEAAQTFMSLAKLSQDDGRQYLLAGYCFWNLNDFPAAARAWQKALTYPPWQKKAQTLLRTLKTVARE